LLQNDLVFISETKIDIGSWQELVEQLMIRSLLEQNHLQKDIGT